MFQYLKNKAHNNGNIFLQETHSSQNSQDEQNHKFKGELYFSHGATNSCGVMIGLTTMNNVSVRKNQQEQQRQNSYC